MLHGTAPRAASDSPAPERLVGADRTLVVLTTLAGYPEGASLEEITAAVGSPKPTVHRALGVLRRAGLAEQLGPGHYVLGDEFLRLAFAHHQARPDHVRVRPALEALAARFGETAHYTALDGDDVVYRAKVDPAEGAVRLTSVVGGRNPAHCTAAGKLLLSFALTDRDQVAAWTGSRTLERRTDRTPTSVDALHRELAQARERGFSVDDQENEPGINCLAVPVFLTGPTTPSGAISVSALAYRTPLTVLVDALDEIRDLAGARR
ncbi:allantoin degradation transcriptional regulator AllR [Nocardioides marinquilinus]|uniref:Allantoin degradation transcriptional regulator AllR n=1 Tax=Nocardioides marinquilinus TaxID=1210400 RepID=A0ABP9PGY1_9ACTN